MKITYAPNPLNSVIELEPHEVELFRHRLIIDELLDAICGGWMHLDKDDSQWYNPDKAREELDFAYWQSDEFNQRIDQLLSVYVTALKGPHGGDCTCVPCSCCKCHAEDILGINTIEGLNKHWAYKIDNAFKGLLCDRTIDEAIRKLENYKPRASWTGWEKHIPHWNAEAADAVVWLKKYRDDHFKGE